MPDLLDGESTEMQGSGKSPYVLKNVGGVYSCTCPAWRNQSVGIEKRSCKHLRKLRGDAAEAARVGSAAPPARKPAPEGGDDEGEEGKGPPLLLAHVWENDVDLTDWWMSEKLDGVRAYWDGRQLLSRLGNILHAPDWFLEGLPSAPLDGELWLDRKAFQRTISIVRRQDKSDHWKQIRYVVFDAPALAEPFEVRVGFVSDTLKRMASPYIQALEQRRCRNVDHLREELQRIESLGGEGLMLRQPGSRYEAGRSTSLLKVKTFHDADAVVVEHVGGKGRHKGRLGALTVKLPDGTVFNVGTGFSDKQRDNPPAVGSTITFRYQEFSTGGVPRFPSFVRMRGDAPPASFSTGATPDTRETGSRSGKSVKSDKSQSATNDASTARSTVASETSGIASPATPTSSSAAPGGEDIPLRRYELVEGNSSKFWEVSTSGQEFTVRYGRIGSAGTSKTTACADAASARAAAEKLIAEKTKKGYAES